MAWSAYLCVFAGTQVALTASDAWFATALTGVVGTVQVGGTEAVAVTGRARVLQLIVVAL